MAGSRPSPSLFRDERGTAFLESAIVLPVVVLLLFGIIEIGRALQQHHALTKAVRDAGRYLARVYLDCPATADPDWAAAKAAAQNLALTGQLSGGTPLIDGWTAASFAIADPTCDTWSGREVQLITITGDVPYQDLGFIDALGVAPFRMRAQHQQLHIGE